MLVNTFTLDAGGLLGGNRTYSRRGTSNTESLGKFQVPGGEMVVEIRQKSTRARKRHEMVLTLTKTATDPLTSVLSEVSASVGVFFDENKLGFTDAELVGMFSGISDVLLRDTQSFALAIIDGDT